MSTVDAAIIKAMTNDYATAEHTHENITNDLNVQGSVSAYHLNLGASRLSGTVDNFAMFHNDVCIAWATEGMFNIIGRVNTPGITVDGIIINNPNTSNHFNLWLNNDHQLIAQSKDGTITETLVGGSRTITHLTNLSGEVGTFCEATGEIYDGYEKIDNTDCICKVRTASSLSSKVVGIITGEKSFASHGDALVKVIPGSYNIGDILAPAENGYGRKATSDELQFMVLNSVPMVKITSINTGIANTVATFIR